MNLTLGELRSDLGPHMFFRGRCARHDIFRLDDLLNAILDLRYLDAIQIHETMFPPCCGALQRLTAETKHEKMS